MLIAIVITVALLVPVLVAEKLGRRDLVWVFKPAASTGFIVTALLAGALDSSYGLAILVALVLSWFGDVFLIPKSKTWFRAGLVSFLLGHVAFAVAFFVLGVDIVWVAVAIVVLLLIALRIDRWLSPHVSADMKVPVRAYITVISVMVAAAAGTLGAGAHWAILTGAALFWASDLFVARQRFVVSAHVNRLVGLPLYYAGQLVLAVTISL